MHKVHPAKTRAKQTPKDTVQCVKVPNITPTMWAVTLALIWLAAFAAAITR